MGSDVLLNWDNPQDDGGSKGNFTYKVVTIGENGVTLDDILTHDVTDQDGTLHRMLAMMDGHELPLAVGVIRSVEAPVYDQEVKAQIESVRAQTNRRTLRDYLLTRDTWEVK